MPARSNTQDEKAALVARCGLMLDAIERAEPGATWAELRTVLESVANRVVPLRQLAQELTNMAALLPRPARTELDQALANAGIDLTAERAAEQAAVAKIQARGRIRSEADYRRVQAYADKLSASNAEAEFLALAALLDEYMSRGAT